MNATDGATVIGAQTILRGELGGTANLMIEGQVEGKVIVPGSRVTVGEQGRVRASIEAQEIIVAGSVQGDLSAAGWIRLMPTASVVGDIASPRFIMEDLSSLRGNVSPVAQAPTGDVTQQTASDASAHGAGSFAQLNSLLDDATAEPVAPSTP